MNCSTELWSGDDVFSGHKCVPGNSSGTGEKEDCKRFLANNVGKLNITDFSLHSIGVILFRYGKEEIFRRFVEDVIPNSSVLSLPVELYGEVVRVREEWKLDFDDGYQYSVARHYGLKVATMDKDFERVDEVEVLFL